MPSRKSEALLRQYLLWPVIIALLAFTGVSAALADNAAFDLTGPKIEMKVTRGEKTLPISEVPNLQPGDRLWIHPDFPDDQSAHYLLVVAFLRGTTNPPPEDWFSRAETWNRRVREEGIVVTVPPDAQQALLFLAPETGGDYGTLRSAVRSKPGVFVRASQDLNQASLDRTRSDRYMAEVKQTSDFDPKTLHDRSVLLARTLGMKLDEGCFDRPPEQQSSCLIQNTDQLVLDDGQSQSVVAALTSGPSSDLAGAVSATSLAGGGVYSAYVGAVVDLARIFGSLHTASYQYIPALSVPNGIQMNLRLNNPPSFRKPMSVLVTGLPAVEAAQLPPLRSSNKDQVYCLEKAPLVLPAEGAPLVFSTDIAHDFVLHLEGKAGESIDLPAVADPSHGGFVIDAHTLVSDKLGDDVKGTLRGRWGFDSFEGPAFRLQNSHAANWVVPAADQGALIVGRDDVLHVDSDAAACVESVSVKSQQAAEIKPSWHALKPNELEIHVPLKDATAGPLKLAIQQYGRATPDEVSLHAYTQAAKLDAFKISAGDQQGVLIGTRLDQVNSFEIKGIRFVPAKLSRAGQQDQLQLAAAQAPLPAALQPEEKLTARVDLKDGRVLDLQTTVEPPRPKVDLISKNVQPGATRSPIHFTNTDSLPQDARLTFFLKTEVPESFPRTEKIEVASLDGSFDVQLSLADGTLVLQNSQTVMAVLDPLKSFGGSAFGPLHFRPVAADGGTGDWQPLATLVRIPSLTEIRCPDSPDKQCHLNGSNLFLIDSVASDPQFTHAVSVPIGFADSSLSVPRPNGTLLYIKLRDDPATVDTLILAVFPEGQ
ncbi:MAG TPA: hypothetical protein VG322_10550 [Candidatus Acidoferrales bacterium]|nr:hypothetical protein [Candidatus Acidoferrales bacterium]